MVSVSLRKKQKPFAHTWHTFMAVAIRSFTASTKPSGSGHSCTHSDSKQARVHDCQRQRHTRDLNKSAGVHTSLHAPLLPKDKGGDSKRQCVQFGRGRSWGGGKRRTCSLARSNMRWPASRPLLRTMAEKRSMKLVRSCSESSVAMPPSRRRMLTLSPVSTPRAIVCVCVCVCVSVSVCLCLCVCISV